MNPLTNVKNITKLGETELRMGIAGGTASWHNQYKDSAWIFVGGLPYDLSEGDVICVFSQYGEIVNINLVRDKVTGKSKGFCFLCYEDQRSTILAVDNLNGIKVLGRTIRVDHVAEYKVPKDPDKLDDEAKKILYEGVAPGTTAASSAFRPYDMKETKKERRPEDERGSRDDRSAMKDTLRSSDRKEKREKKKKEKKKKHKRRHSSSSDSDSSSASSSSTDSERRRKKMKSEKVDKHSDSYKRSKSRWDERR